MSSANVYLKIIGKWVLAFIVAFITVNFLCFLYERPVGWMDTPNGVSKSVWHPNTVIVKATEGFGVTLVDENGYINSKGSIMNPMILVMGSSHTQGKEIREEERYITICNRYYQQSPDELLLYSIASDGNYLPSQIKHFKAATQCFSTAEIIIIEITDTDYSVDSLIEAKNQVEYSQMDTADKFSKLGLKDTFRIIIKEYVPLISMIKTQIEASKTSINSKKEYCEDILKYEYVINEDLCLMRSEFEGNIAFLYHPATMIDTDGKLKLIYPTTWNQFSDACVNNRIGIIDLGPYMIKEYENSFQVPYGFSNTTPGTGHLNKVGHRIAAEAVIDYLEVQKR